MGTCLSKFGDCFLWVGTKLAALSGVVEPEDVVPPEQQGSSGLEAQVSASSHLEVNGAVCDSEAQTTSHPAAPQTKTKFKTIYLVKYDGHSKRRKKPRIQKVVTKKATVKKCVVESAGVEEASNERKTMHRGLSYYHVNGPMGRSVHTLTRIRPSRSNKPSMVELNTDNPNE